MKAILAKLSDADIADAASYYARQRIKPDKPANVSRTALGRQIFLDGIRGTVPSCAACHSAASASGPSGFGRRPMMGGMMGRAGGMGMMGGTGMMGPAAGRAIPRLKGQHCAYLVGQLERFAEHERESPLMNRIAAAMSPKERAQVAAYLASRR